MADHGWQYLTPREREICRGLVDCLTNAEIGSQLGISVSTVQNHVHAVLKKFRVRRRREVIARYSRPPLSETQE